MAEKEEVQVETAIIAGKTAPASKEEIIPEETAEVKKEESVTSKEDETLKDMWDKQSGGVQKRYNELVRDRENAKRKAKDVEEDRDYWRKESLRLQKLNEEKIKEISTPIKVTDEPKPEDFDTFEEHLKALTEWRIKTETEKISKKFDDILSKQGETLSKQQEIEKKKVIESKFEKGRKDHPDFDEVALSKDVPYNDAMLEVVLNSDKASDIAYYLGSHLDKVVEIFNMPPFFAAAEIGKIEALLSVTSDKVTSNIDKKISKAPEPISPVGSSEIIRKDLDKIEDMDEFRREYEKMYPAKRI